MTSNIHLRISLLKTPPPFNSSRFELWQDRFRIFIQSVNHELCETITNGTFFPTYQVNGEVLNKHDSLLTKEEKIKFQLDFKTKSFVIR